MPAPRHTDPHDREPTTEPANRPADSATPSPSIPDQVLALQRSAGNAAVGRLLRTTAALTEDSRARVAEAFAFWRDAAGTPASKQDARAKLEHAPEQILTVLPDDAAPGGPASAAPAEDLDEPAAGGKPRPADAGYKTPPVAGPDATVEETDAAAAGPDAAAAGPEQPNYKTPPVSAPAGSTVGYDARTTGRPRPAAAEAQQPATPVVGPRPRKGWGAIRSVVKPSAPTILEGRKGPLKPLHWATYWLEALDPAHRPGFELAAKWDEWAESATDLDFWVWLDTHGGFEMSQVDYLDTQAERQKYMLLSKDGKLWQSRKEYSTLTAYAPYGGASGWSIFVLSAAGVFYGAESKEGRFHHSTIMAGAAVRAAGEIRVEGGKLIGITPYSGHYRPGSDHLMYALQQLAARGVEVAGAAVGHVSADGASCTWYEAVDYLARGTSAKRVPRPEGHSQG